jgi:hypothetical protein
MRSERRFMLRPTHCQCGAAIAQNTLEQLEAILAANDGTCDCCGKEILPRRDGGDGRCIDHDHATGKIRGVTCTRCNCAMHALDLRFHDPELYEKLMRFSARGHE